MRLLRLVLGLLLASVLGACAALPHAQPVAPSRAFIGAGDTALGRIAQAASPDPELTGFRLLPAADFALHARLDLVQRAQRALDVQYYQIADDVTGRHFLRALRDAAQRGVRVRLLIDDLYTVGQDDMLLALAATPNLELRLFNPFPAGRGSMLLRFAASLADVGRVHRRMHNKLLIADGAMAIAGGRNIGDAYLRPASAQSFLDLDTFIAGALLPRLGELFDRYWNSAHVRDVRTVATTAASPAALQATFERMTGPDSTPPPRAPAPNDVLGHGPIADELDAGKLGLVWASASAYADDPDRVIGKSKTYGGVPLSDVDAVRYNVRERMRRARFAVTLVSPYLVPGEAGLAVLRELGQRHVQVDIVTNSLASTDEPLVHGAYRRHRPDMLRLGAELWEVGATRSRRSPRLGLLGSTTGRLHAKAAVFDAAVLYLGSMNLDPRSDLHNTEIGVFIDSPPLAQQVLRLIDTLKRQGAYRVRLAPDAAGLQWISGDGPTAPVLTEEPESDFWTRLRLNLLAPLVPENLL